tara:strand:+ start:189 stop:638 length:450 start_codon:yes stop_codon:yes gene_type:complete
MKEHMQTVINVCLAIFITVFIYQNGKQQDRINTLEAQTSKPIKDQALMSDLSLLEVVVMDNSEVLETLINNWEQQDTYNEGLKDLLDKVADSINNHEIEIDDIKNLIRRLPKPKTTADIKKVIKGCEVKSFDTSGPAIVNMHGHKVIKC